MKFFVRATDLANPPHRSEAEVILNLISPDSSLLRFSNDQYMFNISEDVPLNTVVGRLEIRNEIRKIYSNDAENFYS